MDSLAITPLGKTDQVAPKQLYTDSGKAFVLSIPEPRPSIEHVAERKKGRR
jgi:hypothetical protein